MATIKDLEKYIDYEFSSGCYIRTKEAPNTPLVTVEYSPSRKKILQCYGKNDSTPNDNILEFVNKKWLPFANRQLKKLAA